LRTTQQNQGNVQHLMRYIAQKENANFIRVQTTERRIRKWMVDYEVLYELYVVQEKPMHEIATN